MKYILTILLLTPLTSWTQTVLTGKVSVCKECKGVGMTARDKETGRDSYTIKTSKNKKGELRTEIIYAPYKLIQNKQIIASGTTNSDGEFKIENLRSGNYEIQIHINRFLRADTLIELSKNRTRIEIELDDKHLWRYLDSVGKVSLQQRDCQKGY